MKLNYNILWIDDRKDAVEPISDSINEYLDELGFELTTNLHKDGSMIDSLILETEIDLIIIDYNLGRTKGDDIVRQIRQKEKYVQIILYSQVANTDLRDKISDLDGVYRTTREDIEDVIRGVISRTIKKSQDISIMRGLVIAEAIDIETKIEEIMSKCFGEKGELFQRRVLNKEIYDFEKKQAFIGGVLSDLISKMRNKIRGEVGIEEGENIDTIKDILKKIELHKKIHKKFHDEIVEKRNMLAHVDETFDEEGKLLLKSLKSSKQDIEFTIEWCKQMRKDLIKHSQNLENIQKYI